MQQAVDQRCRALKQDPDKPQLWLELGSLLVKQSEYAEAKDVFRMGAARHPTNEMLSAAALTFGGDSDAYWRAEPPARAPPFAAAPEAPLGDGAFTSYEAPESLLSAPDQSDRALDWAQSAHDTRERGAVHISNRPLLDPDDCKWLIRQVEAQCEANGGWSTQRHVQAPTTDIPISQVPAVREWFDHQLEHTLFPMLVARYPHAIRCKEELRVMDAFAVRYDATAQASLPTHQDENAFSFTIALNDKGEYEGGGTCFEELRPVGDTTATFKPTSLNADAGGVVAFPGKLRHGGSTVTRGRRYIIPLFIYLDANRSGRQPGYILSSMGCELPKDGGLSRYAAAVGRG